ncbi:MAG: exosortase-associated EpsI family protein [Planctomycetia bacterium]|nr:exosortase-associated EpsI family protein [Planctomycetia bacterium]
MPVKRTWLAIVVLAVISLLGDFICRLQGDSAGHDKLMQTAGERVHLLPDRIEGWRKAQSEPLTEDVLRMLQCREHESRVYVDDRTGESVTLILLAGKAGPLLAHTPEVCYSSVDYECVEPAHPETIRGTGDSANAFNAGASRRGPGWLPIIHD